jgi:hypothetical protein
VKAKNEDGSVLFEGSLNRHEVGFLIQYAVNALMASGAVFELDKPEENEDDIRIKFSKKEHQH